MRHEVIRSLLGMAALAMLVAGCGFQLRGQARLPFESVHIEAAGNSSIAPLLTQKLRLHDKLVLAKPEGAQLRIRISQEHKGKEILSLSGDGKVREYRVEYRLTLAALNAAGAEVLPATTMRATRDLSYEDTQVLAKEAEEARLNRDMQQDMLQQVLRRLAFAKP